MTKSGDSIAIVAEVSSKMESELEKLYRNQDVAS